MSPTLRQYGRRAKQPEPNSDSEFELPAISSDADSKEDAACSDSDASEYEKKRPTKQRKSTKSTPAKSSRKSKSADKTCHLMSMPLDVLFEIFALLRPEDLIRLARTNKAVRVHMLSKGASSLWKVSRENEDGPDCPEDLSEQQWSHLLYGEAWCQSCDAKKIQRVDFGLRRRACGLCFKSNLVVASSFKRRFPHLDRTLLDLIPYTNIGGNTRGQASQNNFYWRDDIEDMEQTLAFHEREIKMQATDARKNFEDFRVKRVALVADRVAQSKLCNNWSQTSTRRRRQEAANKKQERIHAIEDKFIQLGYTADDVRYLKYEKEACQPTALTDRIWKNIRPSLEPHVAAERNLRLKKEREARITARIRLIHDIFQNHKKTLVPNQWRHLPGLFEVVQFPDFKAVVDAPHDVDVGVDHFKDAETALPDLLVSWTAAHKAHLAHLINASFNSEPGSSSTTATPTVLDITCLNLATAVFKCCQHYCQGYGGNTLLDSPCIIGWDAAVAHHCKEGSYQWLSQPNMDLTETVLYFSKRGSDAAASVIAVASLKAEHATCAEMDALNLLFQCTLCSPYKINDRLSYEVFTWRTAVSHYEANTMKSHAGSPSWRILTAVEAGQIEANELPDPTPSWSCNHCSQHLDDCQEYPEVAEHVKTSHAIPSPTAPEDLFRYIDAPLPPTIFTLPISALAKSRCLQCASLDQAAREHLFDLDGVLCHLKTKHHVSDPVQDVDWGIVS